MRKLLFLFLWLMPLFADAAHQPAMWQPFYKQSFTGRNLSTSPLTVGGLKGDTYDYKVIISQRSGTAASHPLRMRLNNDSGTNYRNYSLQGNGSTVYAQVYNTLNNALLTYGQVANYPSASIYDITGKSGEERVISGLMSMAYYWVQQTP